MRSPQQKILTREDTLARLGRPREGTLAFTNGCFDILHRGHAEYLAHARSLANSLIVAVNSDSSVRRLKGSGRPINPESDRAILLASLEAVDWVTIFNEETPQRLIADLLPDILVKGGDYSPEQIVGAREVVAAGGRVIVAPLVPGRSTTDLIRRTSTGTDDPDSP